MNRRSIFTLSAIAVLGLALVGACANGGTDATNLQVAVRLVVSESTVKSHVKQILRKLAAANRAEAVFLYLSQEAG